MTIAVAAPPTERRTGGLLPTLPGMVRGVVGMDRSGPRTVYTLQCERCHALEETDMLILMKTHFHARSPKDQNPRMCPPCRMEVHPDCICDSCRDDRRTS